MSMMTCLASHTPLEALPNPHMKLLSINEALELGIKVPDSLLYSDVDYDEPETYLWSDIEISIDMDPLTGEVTVTGDVDDNFDIWPVDMVDTLRTQRPFLAAVEWGNPTPGRAAMLLDYIRRHLETAEDVELWQLWMGCEGEEQPYVKRRSVKLAELTAEIVFNHVQSDVFAHSFPHVDSITQYCLTITR